ACLSQNLHAESAPIKQNAHISQQNGKVTGTVEDVLGPVTGASVIVKGTTNGTITDIDGNFSLEGIPNGATIQISFIGYVSQEIVYNGQTNLSIHLQEDTQLLGEVVVTALGIKREKSIRICYPGIKRR
ncbi:MAG: carboxypeptidase-like regulatory domain-containing protein, partial [Tannerellaceae bacterium]|nr:carboxypeptidase-like regulatory domain-containing protein [Tannerellaceae bacterium]